MSEMSIQERLYPTITCFGCGMANPDGLHLKSYLAPGGSRALFTPTVPLHDNGLGFVNGGILSTILDCHTASIVMHEADARGYLVPGGPPLAFVTAGFDVKFLRPTPLGPELELWAEAERIDENDAIVRGEVREGGKVRVTMRATWKRFRPR
jgi:acyl-coenzyme A thioesterase PaaI-like protein